MTLRTKLAIAASLTTLIFVCWTVVDAQQTYPSTGVDGFNQTNEAWPVSPPAVLDQQSGADAEMSPDHWGSSASDENPNSYQTASTSQDWDADLESHPWLDEYDGFEPGQANAINVGQEEEKTVPLPPSSAKKQQPREGTGAKQVESSPKPAQKSEAKPIESTEGASNDGKSTAGASNDSNKPDSANSQHAADGSSQPTDDVAQEPPTTSQSGCNCPSCTENQSLNTQMVPHNDPTACGCNTCRLSRGRFLGRNRGTRVWNDYRANGRNVNQNCNAPVMPPFAHGHSSQVRPRVMPQIRSQLASPFGGRLQNGRQNQGRFTGSRNNCNSCENMPSAPMSAPWSGANSDFSYDYYQPPRRFGFFQGLFGTRERPSRLNNGLFRRNGSVWHQQPNVAVSSFDWQNEHVVPSGAYPMEASQQYQPNETTEMSGRYPTTSMVGFSENEQLPKVPVPPSMVRNAPLQGNNMPVDGEVVGAPHMQPKYRPDLGHRNAMPTQRGYTMQDNGQDFGYEKEQFPGMREIIATGRFFGSIETNVVKPFFQNNNSISQSTGSNQSFDFDYEVAPEFQVGFESKYGPGVEFNYFQFDQNSENAVFVSDGVNAGTTSVFSEGGNYWTRIVADDAGETLNVDHSLEVHQFSMTFFKELKFRRSRLNGKFGLQYVSIAQELDAELTDGGGANIGNLRHVTDMRAYGPKVGFEYFRPIGHTPLALVNTFGGSLLFGNRDQFIQNSYTNQTSQVGADEFLSIFDIGFAIQSHRRIGETRSVFWRIGYTTQAWLGGGTASHAQDDFGFRGVAFSLGFNR